MGHPNLNLWMDSNEKSERRSIESRTSHLFLRKKLKLNQIKGQKWRAFQTQERRNRIHKKIGKQFQDQLNGLKFDHFKSQHIYEKERRISDYCWYINGRKNIVYTGYKTVCKLLHFTDRCCTCWHNLVIDRSDPGAKYYYCVLNIIIIIKLLFYSL